MNDAPIMERQRSGYGRTETAMAARITRSAANAECDASWNEANGRHDLADVIARIRAITEQS